ncbi:hypothetical protein [uncultured Methylobacterium sp.]|uniref:hypothetical protein n=1 Tax=uncultured Methylobacterium sp. TaxID=157278 RepID=UPI0035CC34B0
MAGTLHWFSDPLTLKDTSPREVKSMPPLNFGYVWRDRGEHRRYGTVMALFTPTLPNEGPQAFSDAWKALKPALDAVGYSWTSVIEREGIQPCWWRIPDLAPIDVPALQARVDGAIAAEVAHRERKERDREERWSREVGLHAERAAPIRSALERVVAEHPWQLGRKLGEARQLLAEAEWGEWACRYGERYLGNAAGNAERARERLARPWLAQWYARAEDPDVIAAAHEACRVLSALDSDWASTRNSEGWSQATCWGGHLLSDMEHLDRGQAAHALALLFGHRLQLDDALAIRCFGEAPVRKAPRRARFAAGPLLAAAGS